MLKFRRERSLLHARELDPLVEGQSQETEQELLVLVTETPDRLRVLVHNDDVTPYDFVVLVLQSVFMLEAGEAQRVTLAAHTSGVALVAVLPVWRRAKLQTKNPLRIAAGSSQHAGWQPVWRVLRLAEEVQLAADEHS
jgi:ATP-dependent Clp protease adapter protein ClpS